jgi:hypothetical protein
MDEKLKKDFVFLNPRSEGEPVNPHVFRVNPQTETDYRDVQRRFRELSERIAANKQEE